MIKCGDCDKGPRNWLPNAGLVSAFVSHTQLSALVSVVSPDLASSEGRGDHWPSAQDQRSRVLLFTDEEIAPRVFLSDLIKTVKENIKFVQSDQNGVIWHLELRWNWTDVGIVLWLASNVCIMFTFQPFRKRELYLKHCLCFEVLLFFPGTSPRLGGFIHLEHHLNWSYYQYPRFLRQFWDENWENRDL